MKKIILLALTMLSLTVSAQQLQTPNLKFGKPTNEELTMKAYDRDTSATAVVLCQLTNVEYELGAEYSMTQTTTVKTRIKVLKAEGNKFADVSIPFFNDPGKEHRQQSITDLKVVTYNVENGKTKKTILPDNLIFRKNLGNNHYSMNFSAANVKPGSVIEYTYKKFSNIWFALDDYYAQCQIPVVYCHYYAEIPSILLLNVQYTKLPNFTSNVSRGALTLPANSYGESPVSLSTNIYEATGHYLAAIKADDYLYCPKDYSARVQNELKAVQWPNQAPQTLSENWNDVDKTLLNYPYFGGYLNNHSKLKDEIAASGIANIKDFKEKVAALFVLMRKHAAWNGEYRLYPDYTNDPLKTGKGSNADLNMLFISMLNDLSITNHPVVMSSRSNGSLSPIFANLEYLNTFIVSVTDGVNTYYIDASATNGYVDILPAELLVDRARMIGKGFTSKWVNLQNISAAQTTMSEVVDINSQGVESSKFTARYSGSASANMKGRYLTATDSAAWVSSIANNNGVEISNYFIEGPKEFSPNVKETMTFTRQLETTGEQIYVSPFTFRQFDNNPFAAEKRDYPVEFPSKSITTYSVYINVPQGYGLEELPHPYNGRTSDGGLTASVNFNFDTANNRIQVLMKYSVNKLLFKQDEYQTMKTMFDKLVEVSNTTLVLKKK